MTLSRANDTFARALLCQLYEGHLQLKGLLDYDQFGDEQGVPRAQAYHVVHELREAGLVDQPVLGPVVQLTPQGVFRVEAEGLIAREVVLAENAIRFQILNALQAHEDKHGPNRWVHVSQLPSLCELTDAEVQRNIGVLEGNYLLEWFAGSVPKITSYGTNQVLTWRGCQARLDEFNKLQALDGVTPSQRGHRLENLLRDVATEEGWEAASQVRSQGQETDVIIHLNLHYFLVSCKWEKEKTEPHVLELLESRVRSRATTNGGLLVSIGGFTDNCITEARYKIPSAHILLFGPEDVASIFTCHTTLTELINEKLQQAMRHRLILVDGKSH